MFVFTVAGLDTVAAAIGFTMRQLALHPELRRSLIADPALVGPVVEEMLRLEPPAPGVTRITTQDVEVCGVRIPKGESVGALCGHGQPRSETDTPIPTPSISPTPTWVT